MHIVVQHRITDPEKFFSIDAEEVAGGGPPGVQGQTFFPSQDQTVAVCVWEAGSIDTPGSGPDPIAPGRFISGRRVRATLCSRGENFDRPTVQFHRYKRSPSVPKGRAALESF